MPKPAVSRRVLRLPQVTEKTGLSDAAIYKAARAGSFPRPIKLTDRASGWLEHEVDAWIERCAEQRDSD
jgi:prophage regulatory protein